MTLSGLVYCAYIGPRGLQKLLETNKSNSMCTFISVPVYLCISLFTNFLTASTYSLESALLHVYPSIYTGTHPSIHPSIRQPLLHPPIYPSTYAMDLPINLSIRPSARLCILCNTIQHRTVQWNVIHPYISVQWILCSELWGALMVSLCPQSRGT